MAAVGCTGGKVNQNFELVAEIRRHLRAAPSGALIDAMAVATTFAQRFDVSVDDIRNIVRVEAERAGTPCANSTLETPAEYWDALQLAIANESGTFVPFTPAGADLFA
jgi:hypothetical protein